MATDPPVPHRDLIRAALERRAAEVRDRLPPTGRSAPAPTPEPPSDPEEALRILMVRLWPRVLDAQATDPDGDAFLDAIRALEKPARGEDLRFLDAWNNAYETVTGARWPGAGRHSSGPFLEAYARVLAHQVERLAP